MNIEPKLNDTGVTFLDGDEDHPLVIKKTQDINDGFLKRLADKRLQSGNSRMGDFVEVCSVPVVVVEKWLKEGFDIHKEPASKILSKLRAENLGAFIATNKRF